MFGWSGSVLRVDLTKGAVTREATDIALAHTYLGARGFGGQIIRDEVAPDTDPLSPANKIVFAPGPLTGTFAPSAGRYEVVTKAPLNNVIAASNSGGAFGPELKFAGYDALIVEGKAAKPVYLWIKNDGAEIRDAGALWGHTTPDTTDLVRAQTDEDAKVACIGPAGEHLSPIATIMNEMHRAAGRSGVGAVMGSKNLKAIAVLGTGAVTIADPERFKAAVMKARKMIQEHPVGGAGLKACGIDDLDAITKANYYCNEYGIDTISLGSTIACAMELFERGIITTKDTDGVQLTFGNVAAMVEMTRKSCTGEGFGAKLAQGSYRLAESYGHTEFSMTVKKQEMPAYDPRGVQGIGLNYATGNRGGCHVRGYTIAIEVLQNGAVMDPVSYTHLRAHETRHDLVCRLLLEKKKNNKTDTKIQYAHYTTTKKANKH